MDPKPLTPDEVRRVVAEQLDQAERTGADGLRVQRERWRAAYYGAPYEGDDELHTSTFVSTDIYDVVEGDVPSMIDVFLKGEEIGRFEPVGEEDEAAAAQETDIVQHMILEKNDFEGVLQDAIREAEIVGDCAAIAEIYLDKRVSPERYEGLGEDELQALLGAEGVEPAGEPQRYAVSETVVDPQTGQAVEVQSPRFNVTLRRTTTQPCVRIETVDINDVLITPSWIWRDLDRCPFVAIRKRYTASELIEYGYDRDQIEELADDPVEQLQGPYSRDIRPGKATQEVIVYTCWIRLDEDGDGKAELRRIVAATSSGDGGTATATQILRFAPTVDPETGETRPGEPDDRETDCINVVIGTTMRRPHQFWGLGFAELVSPIQESKTTLVRGLHNTVRANNDPVVNVAMDLADPTHTLPDVLSPPRPGKVHRMRQPGAVTYDRPPFEIGSLLQAIEHMDTARELKTGVTRYNQGMDADSLNKTATGVMAIADMAQRRATLRARTFASTFVKPLFVLVHKLCKQMGTRDLALRLRGEWVTVDPSSWRDRKDFKISTGLGTGTRAQELANLMTVKQTQLEYAGLGVPVVQPQNLYEVGRKIAEAAGLKQPETAFTDPATLPPAQPPQPDPVQMAALELEAAKIEQSRLKMELDDDFRRDELIVNAELENTKISAQYAAALDTARMAALNKGVADRGSTPAAGSAPKSLSKPEAAAA